MHGSNNLIDQNLNLKNLNLNFKVAQKGIIFPSNKLQKCFIPGILGIHRDLRIYSDQGIHRGHGMHGVEST